MWQGVALTGRNRTGPDCCVKTVDEKNTRLDATCFHIALSIYVECTPAITPAFRLSIQNVDLSDRHAETAVSVNVNGLTIPAHSTTHVYVQRCLLLFWANECINEWIHYHYTIRRRGLQAVYFIEPAISLFMRFLENLASYDTIRYDTVACVLIRALKKLTRYPA